MSVLPNTQPYDDVLAFPPFICIEILSPDGSMSKMTERIDDYLAFGVPHVWIVDPRRRRSFLCAKSGIVETQDNGLRTFDPKIEVPLLEIFESFD